MRFHRVVARSPGDGGGAPESSEGSPEQEAPPATEKPKGKGPAPVPYSVFKETNAKLAVVEGERAKLQAKVEGFEGWKNPEEVATLLADERARAESRVLLADKGVAPAYRDYMLGRMTEAKPEDPGVYLDQLRMTEVAFFGSQSPMGSPGTEQRPPPKSNPDKGGGSQAPGDGRAVTAADVDAMTVPEYLAWKQAGGLDRTRA